MEYEGKSEQNLESSRMDSIKTDSFQSLLESLKKEYNEKLCFRYFQNSWTDSSFNDFYKNCHKLARFFVKKNLENKNILLISESRPEVIEVYFASFCANAVIIPLDIKLSPREVAFIIKEVNPKLVITTKSQYSLLLEASEFVDKKLEVITINEHPDFYNFSDIVQNLDISLPIENTKKTGMIIYTSGSTGRMKGVETKGSQLLFQTASLVRVGFEKGEHRNISMLPMNHLFEVSGTISSLAAGYPICVAHSLEKEDLGLCFQKHQPTQIFSVPLFCKSIMNGVKLNVSDSAPLKRLMFYLLSFISKAIGNQKLSRKLFSPIHEKFGGGLERIIVGGAAADISVIHFFKMIGISVFEGYGLTETAPVIAVNRISQTKAGSVGPLIPGVQGRIDKSTGEIMTKGPHIMQGYYNNTDATTEVLSNDRWFKTGDIGYFDEENFLFITGRIKNLIVLENGKKVHPEEVEKIFDDIDYIQEISIFGDKIKGTSNSKNIVMIVYLDPGFVIKNERKCLSILVNDIQQRSDRLAKYKIPTKIEISANQLPKTTTMKVKHFEVAKAYEARKLDFLFGESRAML
jgi:long-chain acyl-CoA synthetase